MENLKNFMLLFRMEMNANYKPSETELVAMKKSWGNWIGGIAQNARLVSSHQLGFEEATISSSGEVQIGFNPTAKKSVSGNMVLKAVDMDEAIKLAQSCPILGAGGNVEIRNVLMNF